MGNVDRLRLNRGTTSILLIDYQEKLFGAMPEKPREHALSSVCAVLQGAKVLHLPVIATEQYPRGIGPTLSQISGDYPDLNPIEKTEFSCCGNDLALQAITKAADAGRRNFLVMGMETHICVYQTVLDLCSRGFGVHVVQDACLSRRKDNWLLGLSLCRQAGAVVTSTETALFQLLGKAGGDEFKAISRLIK